MSDFIIILCVFDNNQVIYRIERSIRIPDSKLRKVVHCNDIVYSTQPLLSIMHVTADNDVIHSDYNFQIGQIASQHADQINSCSYSKMALLITLLYNLPGRFIHYLFEIHN